MTEKNETLTKLRMNLFFSFNNSPCINYKKVIERVRHLCKAYNIFAWRKQKQAKDSKINTLYDHIIFVYTENINLWMYLYQFLKMLRTK